MMIIQTRFAKMETDLYVQNGISPPLPHNVMIAGHKVTKANKTIVITVDCQDIELFKLINVMLIMIL